MGILCCAERREPLDFEKEHINNNLHLFDGDKRQFDSILTEKYRKSFPDYLRNSNLSTNVSNSNLSPTTTSLKPENVEEASKISEKAETEFYSLDDLNEIEQLEQCDNFEQLFNNPEYQKQQQLEKLEKKSHKTQSEFFSCDNVEQQQNNINNEFNEEDLIEQDYMNQLTIQIYENVQENGWGEPCYQCSKENITIYKKMKEGCPAIYIRAEAVYKNVNVEKLFEQFYEDKNRKTWDKMMKELRVIEKIDEHKDIFYYSIDPGFAVTNREWVIKRIVDKKYCTENNQNINDISMVCYSVEHEKERNDKKGYVRAECIIQGYNLRQEGDDVKMLIISSVDIKGSVPKFIINKMSDSGIKDWIMALKKRMAKQQKK